MIVAYPDKNISLKGVLWDFLSIFDDLNKVKLSKIEKDIFTKNIDGSKLVEIFGYFQIHPDLSRNLNLKVM